MDDEEVLTPRAGLRRRAEHPGPQLAEGDVEEAALLLLADNLVAPALAATEARLLPFRAAQAPLFAAEGLTLAVPGVGAPAAALAAEKLIAAGARRLVAVGYAGALADMPAGALVAVEAALREEGTSAHYGFAGPDVPADAEIAKSLAAGATVAGRVVTTDAPYRETRRKVAAWRAAGALAVEMETAGLFAVASFRGARAGAALVVTDRLTGEGWEPAGAGSVETATGKALALALKVLRA